METAWRGTPNRGAKRHSMAAKIMGFERTAIYPLSLIPFLPGD